MGCIAERLHLHSREAAFAKQRGSFCIAEGHRLYGRDVEKQFNEEYITGAPRDTEMNQQNRPNFSLRLANLWSLNFRTLHCWCGSLSIVQDDVYHTHSIGDGHLAILVGVALLAPVDFNINCGDRT